MYCICRKPDDGQGMIECEECEEWFHYRCVGLKSQKQADSISTWICFVCERVLKVQASLSKRIVNLEVQLAQQAKSLGGQQNNENKDNNIANHVVPVENATETLWKRKLELITNENDELKAKLAVADEKIELLEKKVKLTLNENEDLKASLAQSQRCVELLQKETSFHAVENDGLKLKLAAANSKVELAEKENKSTSDENEALKASLAGAHTVIELLEKKTSVDNNNSQRTPSVHTPKRKSLSLSQKGKQSSQVRKLPNPQSQPTEDQLSDDDFKQNKPKLVSNVCL